MAGVQLDLNTTADNVTNLKRCLLAYADALDAAARASKSFSPPSTRKIIADNFEGEALKTDRSFGTVLRDIEGGGLQYKHDFSASNQPQLASSANALKAAVEAAEGLVRVQKQLAAADAKRAQSIRQGIVNYDFDTTHIHPLYAATSSRPPTAKRANSATPGVKPRMAAAAQMPKGASAPSVSSRPDVLPATTSAAPIPAAPPAPSSTAAFAPIPPTLSQKEKLKQAIDQLFLRSPHDFPSIGLPDWGLLIPNAESPDKYQLRHSTSQSTHPDIHIEVKDDAGLAFTTEKLGAGAPTPDFFKDYFTVIFNSLEASGQKYQLQNSLKDLLAGLQAQHGLANTTEIETGFKNAVTALGGPSTLKNFLQGQTLVDFEAMANTPTAAPSAPAASRLNSAVPPHSTVLSGGSSSSSAASSSLPSGAPWGSTGATHSTGSSTSTSGASTPFSAARRPAAGPGAGVSQHDAALNGDGFTNGNDEPL